MSEDKNLKIKDTSRATKERRSQMGCRVFSVKVQENRLSRAKDEEIMLESAECLRQYLRKLNKLSSTLRGE